MKIICLLGFSYAIIKAVALERKDAATFAIGMTSLAVLVVASLTERFVYWDNLKKRAATQPANRISHED